MRVALLAHELGHLVNRDPSRGLLVEPALNAFRRFAPATGAERTLASVFDPDGGGNRGIAQPLFKLVLWVISRPFLLIHIGLLALGFRDHQRAEYRADAVAARVAGIEALTVLLDRLALSDSIVTTIGYGAPSDACGATVTVREVRPISKPRRARPGRTRRAGRAAVVQG